MYLSYSNVFSASEVILGRRGCIRRVTNLHLTQQVLFSPNAFAMNFLNSTQWDLRKTQLSTPVLATVECQVYAVLAHASLPLFTNNNLYNFLFFI